MQIDYFDIGTDEETVIETPWPLNILATHFANNQVRLYYSLPPGSTPQQVSFYCIKSEQVLPDTFPGKYFATVHIEEKRGDADDALHLFLKTPVNKPKKPIVVKVPSNDPDTSDDETKENESNGADNGAD